MNKEKLCDKCSYSEYALSNNTLGKKIFESKMNQKINRLEFINILLLLIISILFFIIIFEYIKIDFILSENKLYKEMLSAEIIKMDTVKTKMQNGRIVKDD